MASHDAEALRAAMKGFGTDDSTLIEIIGGRNNEQLQSIRAAFHSEFNRDLVADIKSETSGHYELVLVGLVQTRAEFDARCCEEAMHGAGTDEDVLIETLAHRTTHECNAIKAAYLNLYGKTLEHDIKGDTSGAFQKLLLGFINNQKVENLDAGYLNDVRARLYDAGQGKLGTDEDAFVDILTTMGPNSLRALNDLYANTHGNSLLLTMQSEMGGCLVKALDALLIPHDEYYADLIFKAIDGAGTQDHRLIRVIVSRRHVLHDINAAFVHKYQKSLHFRIAGEVSGDYGKILAAITAGL